MACMNTEPRFLLPRHGRDWEAVKVTLQNLREGLLGSPFMNPVCPEGP